MNVQLVLFKEDGQRRDLDVKRESVVFGRSGDCDFQIPLAVISRRHCKLSQKGGKLYVKDLGSSNGTFLNNKRILQAEVKAGDRLTIGPVIFTVVIDGAPTEIEPVVTILNPPAAGTEGAPTVAQAPSGAMAPTVATSSESSEKGSTEKDSGGIDLEADLESLALDESVDVEEDHDALEDSGPSPLAELEELAKQQKK